jgi:hypothetical protein
MKEIGVEHCGIGTPSASGTPRKVQAALERALRHFPIEEVSGHFPRNLRQGVGNVYAALEVGVATFDASSRRASAAAPYAKGRHRQRRTEDVLFMLDGLGIDTGVSMEGLIDAAAFISGVARAEARCRARPTRCSPSGRRRSPDGGVVCPGVHPDVPSRALLRNTRPIVIFPAGDRP